MTRQRKAFLLLFIGGMIIILLIIFMIRVLTPVDLEIAEDQAGDELSNELPLVNTQIEIADVDPEDGENAPEYSDNDLTTELTRMAATFTERFGTFSNQGDYSEILDLDGFMTPTLYAWAQTYIVELEKQHSQKQGYYSVSTRAISVQTRALDSQNGVAEFLIIAQRSAVDGAKAANVYYQNLIMKMIFTGGEWKVDFVK